MLENDDSYAFPWKTLEKAVMFGKGVLGEAGEEHDAGMVAAFCERPPLPEDGGQEEGQERVPKWHVLYEPVAGGRPARSDNVAEPEYRLLIEKPLEVETFKSSLRTEVMPAAAATRVSPEPELSVAGGDAAGMGEHDDLRWYTEEEPMQFKRDSGASQNLDARLSELGLESFKPMQQQVTRAILDKNNRQIVVHMATGAGKSLLYQLPAYIEAQKKRKDRPNFTRITLVFLPLRALIKDQLDRLHSLRDGRNKPLLHGYALSGNTPDDNQTYLQKVISEKICCHVRCSRVDSQPQAPTIV